jgi:hypothetical protein
MAIPLTGYPPETLTVRQSPLWPILLRLDATIFGVVD